jgi:hypothetical protein
MTAEICAAASSILDSPTPQPEVPALSTTYPFIQPLALAGECLLEQLAIRTAGIEKPDSSDQKSMQLAWVIGKLEWIAETIGVRWAAALAEDLGERRRTGAHDHRRDRDI